MGYYQGDDYISDYAGPEIDNLLGKTVWQSNPNLLDNWYFVGGGSQQGGGQFPINQRGQTSYTGSGYGIDRWNIKWSGTVTIFADGMEVMSNTTLDEIAERAYPPGSYTISTLYSDGSLDTTTLIVSSGSSAWYPSGKANVLIAGTLFRFYIGTSAQRIAAIKLELGDTQTLAHQDASGNWVLNEVPNYQEQLAKCQRYYQIFPSISTIPGGVAPTSSAPIKKEAFRPVMAKDITTSNYGTITIEGSTFYFADANL